MTLSRSWNQRPLTRAHDDQCYADSGEEGVTLCFRIVALLGKGLHQRPAITIPSLRPTTAGGRSTGMFRVAAGQT